MQLNETKNKQKAEDLRNITNNFYKKEIIKTEDGNHQNFTFPFTNFDNFW